MANKGFIGRVLPFLAAFAVGVFITSFFVDLSWRWRPAKRVHEVRRLKIENDTLRNENLRLRNLLENNAWSSSHAPAVEDLPGPVGLEVPPPPPRPRRHRHDR